MLTEFSANFVWENSKLVKETGMKNHADALIFHTAVCAGASQTALIAEEKSPARIFLRGYHAINASEWRLN